MIIYTVKQVAEILKTDEETVRRKIRAGELAAMQTSRKGGNEITDANLDRFIAKNPKYIEVAAATLASSPAIMSIVIGGLIGSLLSFAQRKKAKTITSKDVELFLNKRMLEHEEKIQGLLAEIEQIQEKISLERLTLEKYRRTIENLDLDLIANEINSKL